MPTLQRLRLMPLYGSIWAADRLGDRFPATPRSGFGPWQPGISVVIPERDAPEMLLEALDSLHGALAEIDEPHQVVVVVNGAAPERYVGVLERYPDIEFVYRAEPLGFSAAIVEGLKRVRHDWTFLLNNDVTLDRLALRELVKSRGEDVFAIASQIMQRSASGRREETGFVDWYVDGIGVRVFHADPGATTAVRPHLCASGGAALFRTEPLKRYARDSRCYDPFYWEDVEWGVRAWQDGMRVLFCPLSRAWHKHRVTTTRFYALDEIERMVERNRVLFDARNAIVREGPAWVVARIRELPEASQRELGRLAQAWAIFRQRLRARRLRRLPAPPPLPALAKRQPAAKMPAEAFAYRLRTADPPAVPPRPRVLVVAPFAIYPPRHGGARRIAGLLRELRRDFDIILVADEASIYDVRCMVHFDGLHAVHFVRTEYRRGDSQSTLSERLRTHCHPALVASVEEALQLYHPDIVQIEHVEIAELIHCRRPGQRWTLALHDACDENDFADRAEADWFQRQLLARYDAVTVCSAEDQAMVVHPRVVCVPNAPFTDSGPVRIDDSISGNKRLIKLDLPTPD